MGLVAQGKEDPEVDVAEEDEAGKAVTPASDIFVRRDQRAIGSNRSVDVLGGQRRRRSKSNSFVTRLPNHSCLHSTRQSQWLLSSLSSLSSIPLFLELIAGKLTRLLIGARNNGSESFVVESVDGSLRYPQDFTYYIQNFTLLRPELLLESGLESTFEYLFLPSETFNGRPMGLVVLLNYRNNVRKAKERSVLPSHFLSFSSRKANAFRMLFSTKRSTSSRLMKDSMGKRKCRRLSFILSPSSRFFLYIFLGAIAVLASFLAYQYLLSARVKRAVSKSSSSSSSSSNGLAGQQGKGNYDLDWIPKHHLTQSKANESRRSKERERHARLLFSSCRSFAKVDGTRTEISVDQRTSEWKQSGNRGSIE